MSVPPQPPPGPGQPGPPSPYGPPPGGGQPYGEQYPGQPYPGQQPPPGFTPRMAAPVEKPKEVETAFRLGLISVVLSIIGVVLTFLTASAVAEAAIATGQLPPGITEQQYRQFATVGTAIVAVLILIVIALYLLFMFKMRAGRNWARILLTILGLLWIASGLWGLFTSSAPLIASGPVGIVSVVLSVLQVIVIAAGIFFMFRPAAGPYFQQERV